MWCPSILEIVNQLLRPLLQLPSILLLRLRILRNALKKLVFVKQSKIGINIWSTDTCGLFNSKIQCIRAPCGATYKNPCEACAADNVESYFDGKCNWQHQREWINYRIEENNSLNILVEHVLFDYRKGL